MKKLNKKFSTHKATLVQDTDRYFIVDWRRADGSGDYYVNYILDKKRGNLIVSGDLGDCIATWYNTVTPEKIKSYIYNDIGYYMSKFQAASNAYYYDEDAILANIKDSIGEYVEEEYSDDCEGLSDFWAEVEYDVESSIHGNQFIPCETLIEKISEFDADCLEWLSSCGREIHPRVYLWAEGFYRACEQLGK